MREDVRTYLLSMRIIELNARQKYIYSKIPINMISYWARYARQIYIYIYYTLHILTVVFSYTQAVQYPPVLNA